VQGWIRKAESDLAVLELAVGAEVALDTACFHAQQTAEKYLKAYLLARNVPFPFTHNLVRLVALCETQDPQFATLTSYADSLTPFAAGLRYDGEFWPSMEAAEEALEAAVAIKQFVLQRIPPHLAAGDAATT